MDLQLRGKTAIVTGAGSNIGRAIALTFAAEGANVVIGEIVEEQGNKVVREIEAAGGTAVCYRADVTSIDSVTEMFQKTLARFGQVHVLVNNVGWDIPQMFLNTEPAHWEKIISLNFRSDLNTLKVILPHMIEKKYGRVVNISSDAGRVGEFQEAVYAGCKAGVIALSKAIAREAGKHNITVNAVCPGMIMPQNEDEISNISMWQTMGSANQHQDDGFIERVAKMYPLRRLGKAQDIANAAVFLASEAANYITGQTLSVSGGYSMM